MNWNRKGWNELADCSSSIPMGLEICTFAVHRSWKVRPALAQNHLMVYYFPIWLLRYLVISYLAD